MRDYWGPMGLWVNDGSPPTHSAGARIEIPKFAHAYGEISTPRIMYHPTKPTGS